MKLPPELLNAIPTPDNQTAWYDVIGKFKAKASEFERERLKLEKYKTLAARNPKTKAEFERLSGQGVSIKANIQKITSSVSDTWNWLKSSIGLSGLGILPLIPIAVVAGSVTLMSKWLADAYMFNKKMESIEKLQAKGVSASEASAIVDRADQPIGSGLFGGIGKSVVLIALVGVGAFLIYRGMESRGGRKW